MRLDFLNKFITYGLGNVLQSALSLILLPLYLRYLSPEEYGVVSVLSVTMSLLALTIGAGMMNGLIRLYYETEDLQRKKLIGSTWLWYLTVAALGGVALFTQANTMSVVFFSTDTYGGSFRTIGITFFFIMAQIVPFYILRLEKKAGHYVAFSFVNFIVDFVLKLYFIKSMGLGIEGYFASSAIANMITLVIMIPYVYGNVKFAPDFETTLKLMKLGFPYIFSGIAVWTIDVSDRLLLNHYSGGAAVGVYSVAYNFANIFRVLLATPASLLVDPFFFSFAASRSVEDTRELLKKMLIYSLLAGGVLYLGIALASGEALRVLVNSFGANKDYLNAAELIPILTLAPFVYFLVMPSILGGLWVNKPAVFSVACTFAALANAALNFFVIPKYGAMGAAVTTVIAYLFLFGLSYGRLERFLHGNYPWGKIVCGVFFLVFSFAVGSQFWLNNPIASLLVRALVGVIIFILLVLFTGGILTKAERIKIFSIRTLIKL